MLRLGVAFSAVLAPARRSTIGAGGTGVYAGACSGVKTYITSISKGGIDSNNSQPMHQAGLGGPDEGRILRITGCFQLNIKLGCGPRAVKRRDKKEMYSLECPRVKCHRDASSSVVGDREGK